MRRTPPLSFANQSILETVLPSTSVVDMFGRLFGTILRTLFLKRNTNDELSVLEDSLSQNRRNLDGLFPEKSPVTAKQK
jgi:hypothetical protein